MKKRCRAVGYHLQKFHYILVRSCEGSELIPKREENKALPPAPSEKEVGTMGADAVQRAKLSKDRKKDQDKQNQPADHEPNESEDCLPGA